MATVGIGSIVVAAIVVAVLVAALVWVMRFQRRQFPKGWDRTGWEPGRGDAGWFATKFTWLSGGRGGVDPRLCRD